MPPPIPPPRTAEITVLHDARAVHDCSAFRLSQFIVNGRPAWVVAEIFPGASSGSATLPGAHIQAETGKLVTPRGGQTVIVKEGKWKRLASAAQTEAPNGQYSWAEPLLEKRVLTPEDQYSPFVHGGTILCSPVPGAPSIQQFGMVVLLPEQWDRYVSPTFSVTQQIPALLTDTTPSAEAVAPLSALLHQDNELLATLAFRTLLETGHLSPEAVREAVSAARGYRLSTFAYLLLTARAPAEGRDGQVLARTGEGRDAVALRMLTLGAFSAAHLGGPAAVPRANSLLAALRRQFEAARIPRGRDSYLDAIFDMVGASH